MKVSIISPVYNVERFIDSYLDSVCGQSLEEIEIICVSDASCDGSVEKIKARMEVDKRIRLIELEKNVGAGAARNVGISVASGEYISFVDPDDTISDRFCELLYSAAVGFDADIVVGQLVKYHEGSDRVEGGSLKRLRAIQDSVDSGRYPVSLCGSQYVSCLYRRELFKRWGIEFPKRDECMFVNGEDDVMLLRFLLGVIMECGCIRVVFDKDVFYRYMKRKSSLTSVLSEERYRGVILSRKLALSYLNASSLSEDDYFRLVDRMFNEMGSHYRMYRGMKNFEVLRYIRGMAEFYAMVKKKGRFERKYFRSYLEDLESGSYDAVERLLNCGVCYALDQSRFKGHFLYRMLMG